VDAHDAVGHRVTVPSLPLGVSLTFSMRLLMSSLFRRLSSAWSSPMSKFFDTFAERGATPACAHEPSIHTSPASITAPPISAGSTAVSPALRGRSA
jgi:hypothetical protein